jgi:D-glycero-D-manno-heptose 1,7-bisphosphate phosphatase
MNEPVDSELEVRRAVFLDRDGVLVRAYPEGGGAWRPPRSIAELELLPGVADACTHLRASGFALIVVTNQPDVARGRIERDVVDAQHEWLLSALPLTEIVVCVHDDADACSCRKPAPGMLVDSARRHGVSLDASVMVGDRWRDVEAGRAAGCRTVFVDHGYDERRPVAPDAVVASLTEAVPVILEWAGFETGEETKPG